MSWFLIGGAIGIFISMPVFENVSEKSKFNISFVLMVVVVLIGAISLLFLAGG